VAAFSVAIPLLAALLVVNRQEVFRRRTSRSFLVEATGLLGVAVHSAGYAHLEQDPQPIPPPS